MTLSLLKMPQTKLSQFPPSEGQFSELELTIDTEGKYLIQEQILIR